MFRRKHMIDHPHLFIYIFEHSGYILQLSSYIDQSCQSRDFFPEIFFFKFYSKK